MASRENAIRSGLALATLLLSGCSSTSLDSAVKKVFEPERTPQQYMILAVSDADADVRRQSVGKIATSKQHDKDWAVKGYNAIALLESDPQARCVAIRALVQARDAQAADTCLKIINYKEQPPAEVREPEGVVRTEAMAGLSTLSESGVAADKRDAVRTALLERLAADEDKYVRASAARGLGYYPSDEVVTALIGGLRDEQFMVVYGCEDSLVRLTGVTNECNVGAWTAWYEANRANLFAKAGQVPESRRPKYTNRWEKARYDTGQVAEWLWPGPKKTN